MSQTQRRRLPVLLGGLALLGLVFLGARMPLGEHAQAFVTWVQGLGPWAPLFYVLLFAVSTWFFLPGLVFGVVAGLLFGVVLGGLVMLTGAALGGTTAFLLGRTALRGRVERWIHSKPHLAALDREIGERGLLLAMLLRVSPVVPFNLLNGALALTRLSFRSFAVTLLGAIPELVIWVVVGAAVGLAALAPDRTRTPLEWAILGSGVLVTAVASIAIARFARRRLATLRLELPDEQAVPEAA